MKVLHILNELKPSGAEVMLEKAAPVWLGLGCDLHILALADSPGAYAETLARAGWQVSHLNRSQGIPALLRSLIRRIREIRPDIIHFHQEGISLPLAFAARLAGVPMVRTVHNNFPFSGVLRWRKTLERALCRWMGCQYIAISSSVQENELKRFKNPSELCWNWFDSKGFRPPSPEEKIKARERLGIPTDQIALVSVGNGSDIKNYKVVIGSLVNFKKDNLHYYQVGNSHPADIDATEASDLKVGHRVSFVGSQKNVIEWLWASDIYVMPSFFEGFSIAALEALASGCDCLFADCPGLADFKSLNLIANWVSPDPDAFSTGIRRLLHEPTPNHALISNSTLTCELFDTSRRSQAYHNFWIQTLDRLGDRIPDPNQRHWKRK
jgi:glycosyltransferase involved in cell wall biosynthesis